MKKLLCVLMFGMVFGQAELTTRMYTISLDLGVNSTYEIDMLELTGYALDGAKLEFFKIQNFNLGGANFVSLYLEHSFYIYENSEPQWEKIIAECSSMVGGVDYGVNTTDRVESIYFSGSNTIRLRIQGGSFSGDVSILVKAEFHIEDTGYIEEGFDYCIDVGANLIASPCRDAVPILDTLPSEIADNLTGIIGQGVAANNQNGTWMGSLDGLGGGNGYWFKSNVSACFNYNCAEN